MYISFPDDQTRKSLVFTTDSRGELQFDANGFKTFRANQVGYATCDEHPRGTPPAAYPVDRVLSAGLVSANDCGSTRAQREPGRLVFFVRNGTWGEWTKNARLFQDLRSRAVTVLFDEGHYEPAALWSQVGRVLPCPRIIFTATAFRDDYKTFDIDPDYAFRYGFDQARRARYIRGVQLHSHTHQSDPPWHSRNR